MSGCLYLCATPIGNLDDITLRVLECLRSCGLIAAEDTRGTMKLLNHYDIHKPMTSYHEHNKYEKAEVLIEKLREGTDIALVTDAGTPCLSDPGEVLVQRCMEEGIRVTSLPGACALITALTLSGKSARRFVFEGFLPQEKKERAKVLESLRTEERTIILYEAPHRLKETLEALQEYLGDRDITVVRELTKVYEEAVPTTLGGALAMLAEKPARGEYVLVLAGRDPEEALLEKQEENSRISVREQVEAFEREGMSRKEAMRQTAAARGISRRDVYQELLKDQEND